MVRTILRRVVLGAALAVWMLGLPGCVKQSAYDAKVAEARDEAEKAAKAEAKAARLEKDLATAKTRSARLSRPGTKPRPGSRRSTRRMTT